MHKVWLVIAASSVLLSACVTLPDTPEHKTEAGTDPRVTVVETGKSSSDTGRKPLSEGAPRQGAGDEKALKSAVDRENSVFFPPSGTTLDAKSRQKLRDHAARLKADPSRSVTLIGHTDDLGSPSYNLAIAEQRVNAVFNFLRAQGVPVMQLRRYGMGSEAVDKGCRSTECRALMRRVELDYEP